MTAANIKQQLVLKNLVSYSDFNLSGQVVMWRATTARRRLLFFQHLGERTPTLPTHFRPPCALLIQCNVSSLLLDITYACLHCTMMSLRRLLSSIAAFLLLRDVPPWWMRYFRRLLRPRLLLARLSKSWELVMAFDRARGCAAAASAGDDVWGRKKRAF